MSSASDQLLRLLRLIPLAARPGGISLQEAAALCGVPESQIDKDFERLAERAWYLPPGRTDDFQIIMQGDRVLVEAPPAFERPIRLGLHEMLAVSLALRCAGVDREESRELGRALEAACALDVAGDGVGRSRDDGMEVVLAGGDADEAHDVVARSIVHRRRVRMRYVKEGATAPEVRHVEAWYLLHAEGEAYLVAHDLDREAARLFRMDRVLEARMTDEACEEAVHLEPSEITEGGSARLGTDRGWDEDAEVRYSPGVARWVREHYAGVDTADGGYTVRHPLLSEEWLVRHVLRFGPDAEVVRPARLRDAVLRALGD